MSALQQVLVSDFLSPFTDKIGSSLKKINQRLQSMSSLYEFLQNDLTQVKKEFCDDDSSLNSSLNRMSASLSILQESVSRNDEKTLTLIKNIKNDMSCLSSDMYEREKMRDIASKNQSKEIKNEIQKHSSIDANVDFSAVLSKKLDCFREK